MSPTHSAVAIANEMDTYQVRTRETARYPEMAGQMFIYPSIGLASEAGELLNKVKKIYRDDNGILTSERREAILMELGDVLWYLARTADELDVKLSDVAEANLAHLESRKQRGALHGSGDNR